MEYLFEYTGQERDARKLLIDEKIAPIEDVAVMSSEDVEEKNTRTIRSCSKSR